MRNLPCCLFGSTEMTARLGDSAALELVRAHDALVRRGLDASGGHEIKHTGDGIIAPSITWRTQCAPQPKLRGSAAYNSRPSQTRRYGAQGLGSVRNAVMVVNLDRLGRSTRDVLNPCA
jgi:class 3 adenylate cyclase